MPVLFRQALRYSFGKWREVLSRNRQRHELQLVSMTVPALLQHKVRIQRTVDLHLAVGNNLLDLPLLLQVLEALARE